MHDLREMRRTNLFLALGDEHQIHWQLTAAISKCVQGDEKRCLRSFLVYSAATHYYRSNPWFVDERSLPRRRRPLRRIGLLHVVHEIQPYGSWSTRVERGEDPRLALGRNF